MHNFIANIPSWAVIGPIYILWLVTLTVVVERYLFFRRRRLPADFVTDLDHVLKSGNWHEAEKKCLLQNSPAAQSLLPAFSFINNAGKNRTGKNALSNIESVEFAVQMAGTEQVALLEKNLAILSTVATIAPLFGLLGTVTGMLKSFYFLSRQSTQVITAQFAAGIASGITEALLTTFLGLVVAIPAYIFYNYFVRKIDGFHQEMTRSYYVLHSKIKSDVDNTDSEAQK